MYSPGHLRIPDRANSSVHLASSTDSKYVSSASLYSDGPDLTLSDRDQRAGPEHHHCLACDTCKQRGSGGQTGVGPWWYSRTRRHRKGQTFASRNSPFDVFLTLTLDHRTTCLWPTWSAGTQGCLYVSVLSRLAFF